MAKKNIHTLAALILSLFIVMGAFLVMNFSKKAQEADEVEIPKAEAAGEGWYVAIIARKKTRLVFFA